MKTFKNLYPQVADFENLYHAYRKARRGGKRKKEQVAAFELDLEDNLWRLHQEMGAQTYQPGASTSKTENCLLIQGDEKNGLRI